MVAMWRPTLAICALLVGGCGGNEPTVATTITDQAPTTLLARTTTTQDLTLEVQGCETPPVTFSALCEVYELLQEWHVDGPLDPTVFAGAATEKLGEPTGSETAPAPERLTCAIPDPAFTGLCETMAEVMVETGETAGPLVDVAVVAMVEEVLGPFTYYVPPDLVADSRADSVVGGIGVVLDATDVVGSRCARISTGCPLVIVFVIEGNPGATAGLQAGDQIVTVDGTPVEGEGFSAISRAIAGDETGEVTLEVLRDGETLVFAIERGELVGPLVEVDLPRPGIGYLRIPDFEADIPALVHQALESLSELDPDLMVIDLRDNPGGLLDSCLLVASEFIAEGAVFSAHVDDDSESYPVTGEGLAHGVETVVLVNRGTASAAEILAAALRDREGALVLGTPTFGKDAVQIPFDLRNGGQLVVQVARWASPDGHTVASGGLLPDIELDLSMEMTTEMLVDTVLAVAR